MKNIFYSTCGFFTSNGVGYVPIFFLVDIIKVSDFNYHIQTKILGKFFGKMQKQSSAKVFFEEKNECKF